MFIQTNPNPQQNLVGDCVIRAISLATEKDWEQVFIELSLQGFVMKDMPSSNSVWGAYLMSQGFKRYVIPNTCPDCYTIRDFCNDYPTGTYLVATGTHVVAIKDGNYLDTWDSGNEIPIYYFRKEQ